jgi:outer membrane murein-binding lipoprotein Lpp
MKKLLFVFAIVGLIFLGCNQKPKDAVDEATEKVSTEMEELEEEVEELEKEVKEEGDTVKLDSAGKKEGC